jgi:hypothetical protein
VVLWCFRGVESVYMADFVVLWSMSSGSSVSKDLIGAGPLSS